MHAQNMAIVKSLVSVAWADENFADAERIGFFVVLAAGQAWAVPADDLDYVSHPGHLRLITQKVEDKLTGKEEVVFEPEEVARAAED